MTASNVDPRHLTVVVESLSLLLFLHELDTLFFFFLQHHPANSTAMPILKVSMMVMHRVIEYLVYIKLYSRIALHLSVTGAQTFSRALIPASSELRNAGPRNAVIFSMSDDNST